MFFSFLAAIETILIKPPSEYDTPFIALLSCTAFVNIFHSFVYLCIYFLFALYTIVQFFIQLKANITCCHSFYKFWDSRIGGNRNNVRFSKWFF